MPRPRRSRLRTTGLVALLAALAIGGAAGGYAETTTVRASLDAPAPSASPVPLPSPLAGATAAPGAGGPGGAGASSGAEGSVGAGGSGGPASAAGVRAALTGPLDATALGARVLGQVRDVASGRVLFDRDAATPGAPASTAKLLTAAAALQTFPATHRFVTTLVAGDRPGTVVLVGGGDPTLTAAPPGAKGAYPGAARLSDLAAAVHAKHLTITRVVVDDALFTGPSVSPYWAPGDVPSDYASAITALMADGGRAAPGDLVRSASPDLAAGRAFARLAGAPSATVTRGTAPTGAAVLGSVRSAPLRELVAQMLQPSDNVIAEVLARQVAVATGQPASFAGEVVAVRTVLAGIGVAVGTRMRDGSGLAASDRIAPAALTALLRVLADPVAPARARLREVLAALSVAGWSGTLADRYLPGSGASGVAGAVRAKTGTLTGVATLAGLVHDRSGALLAFALFADRVPTPATDPALPSWQAGTDAADAALDRAVAALGRCGCS